MRHAKVAFWVALPALLLVATSALLSRLWGIRNTALTQDPASLVGYPFYYGLFSHLGVLLWAATASLCLFSWHLLRTIDRDLARYFYFSGLLSALFCFDDLLLLHEDVFPHRLGIDELVVVAAYGLASLAYFVRWYGRIMTEGPGLLIAAVAFLGVSVLIDLWDPSGVDVLVEDGFKLLGIGCWLGHFARAAARDLRRSAPFERSGLSR